MSTPLAPCESCGRHVKPTDDACPFCAAPRSRLAVAAGKIAAMAATVAVGVTLAACYGPPPPRPEPPSNPTPEPTATDTSAPAGTGTDMPMVNPETSK